MEVYEQLRSLANRALDRTVRTVQHMAVLFQST